MNDEMNNLLVKFTNLNHHFNYNDIFYDLSGTIYKNDKIGLIGHNGSGKTTLIKMILGELNPYSGTIINEATSIGYIPQKIDILRNTQNGVSLYEFCFLAYPKIFDEYSLMSKYEQGLLTDTDQYLEALEKYQGLGGYEYQNRIDILLGTAGFTKEAQRQDFSTLSEGQKRLVYLVAILALDKELLILDEPTNHVDANLKKKYTKLIRDYAGAVLVVSHDREVLSEACNSIWEIADMGLETYKGNWESYKAVHEVRLKEKVENYKNTSNEIERHKDLIDRIQRGKSSFNIQVAKGRLAREEKRLARVKPSTEKAKMRANLEYEGKHSKFMLKLNSFNLYLEGKHTINNLNIEMKFGERMALIGGNGIGKSTIFKSILGTCDYARYEGEIIIGNSATIGYHSQTFNLGNENRLLLEYIMEKFDADRSKAHALLNRYLFSNEQAEQLLSELSGGEKSRLQLMQLIEGNYNLLLLDEPTNHLDLESIEQLEELLTNFNGCVLLISHDKYFVEAVSTTQIDLEDFKVK